MAIKRYGFMALWVANMGVYGKSILKMWQSSEDLAKIRPFVQKLEQKYWTDIFSKFLCKQIQPFLGILNTTNV